MAFGLMLAGTIEQQDRVFRDQSHQHDDADEAHQVQRALGQQQTDHDPDQTQRQRQHHRHRGGERAELHHQDQVHQRDAHHEGDEHLAEDFLLVARGTTQREAVALGKIDLLRELQGIRRDLARGASVGIRRNRHHALAVEVLDLRRPLAHGDGGDLVQRHHHVATGHRDRQVLDVLGADAVVRMQAHGDVA